MSEQRGWIPPAQTVQILARLAELPLRLDMTPDSSVVMALADVVPAAGVALLTG